MPGSSTRAGTAAVYVLTASGTKQSGGVRLDILLERLLVNNSVYGFQFIRTQAISLFGHFDTLLHSICP